MQEAMLMTVTYGYGTIEACMTRHYASLYPLMKLRYRECCPNKVQWRLPTADQITISSITSVIDFIHLPHLMTPWLSSFLA